MRHFFARGEVVSTSCPRGHSQAQDPTMKIVAIETSSARGGVALLDDDRLVAERKFKKGARHGRELLPCVEQLLGGEPKSIGLIAVSAGPGSYTGLRVGITFAKTFAVQSGTPVVSVSSLDVIAANVTQRRGVCVVVDARLGRVYAAMYDADRNKVMDDAAVSPDEVAARLIPDILVIGDGLRRYRGTFAAVAEVVDDESTWWPQAANVGRLGRARFAEAGGEDPHGLTPRYLARAQAEVKWEELRSASGPK